MSITQLNPSIKLAVNELALTLEAHIGMQFYMM